MATNETNDRDTWNRPPGEADAIVGDPPTPYRERNFHDSHGVDTATLSQENRSWLATRDRDLDLVVAVERIRDENPRAYAAIMRSTADDTKTRILRTILVRQGTATYDDLDDFVGGVTTRTIKTKVAELRDEDVLDVGEGRPAAIGFVDRDVALLAEDALARLDRA